jgi:hypothetical protein
MDGYIFTDVQFTKIFQNVWTWWNYATKREQRVCWDLK